MPSEAPPVEGDDGGEAETGTGPEEIPKTKYELAMEAKAARKEVRRKRRAERAKLEKKLAAEEAAKKRLEAARAALRGDPPDLCVGDTRVH